MMPRSVLAALVACAFLIAAMPAQACDVLLTPVDELLANPRMAVLKGRFIAAPKSDAPERVVFLVKQVFRGDIAPGEYEVAAEGPLGNQCEVLRVAVSEYELSGIAPDKTSLLRKTGYFLLVSGREKNLLLLPMSAELSLTEREGRVHRRNGSWMPAATLENYLRRVQAQPDTPVPDWSSVGVEANQQQTPSW